LFVGATTILLSIFREFKGVRFELSL